MSTAPPSPPPLDVALALSMLGDDTPLLRDAVALLMAELPRLTRELHVALETGRPEHARFAAHALKGALAPLGVVEGARLAASIEALGRVGNLQGSQELLDQLDAELERLRAFVASPGWLDAG